MFDTFSSKTQKIDVKLQIGPCTNDRFLEGEDITNYMSPKDGIYFSNEDTSFVIILGGMIECVSNDKYLIEDKYYDLGRFDYCGNDLLL